MTQLFQCCPLGCESALKPTQITLPEGRLHRCTECGQLISVCTIETFEHTMQEWEHEDGTMPTGRDAIRHRKRISKLLSEILSPLARMVGKGHQMYAYLRKD